MEQIIKDKAPKPAGLVPKNLQAFFIVALALLMVLVMAITGHKRPVPASTAGTIPALPSLLPVNSQKVTDFQKDIEQAQRESAPQVEAALLQQQKQLASPSSRTAQPFAATAYGIPVTVADPGGVYPPGAYAASQPEVRESAEQSDAIREEQKKRAYFSLFSDNLALTYRKESAWRAESAISISGDNRARFRPGFHPMQFPVTLPARAELPAESQLLALRQAAGMIAATAGFPCGGNAADTASTSESSPSGSARTGAAAGEPRKPDLQPERESSTSCLKAQFLKHC